MFSRITNNRRSKFVTGTDIIVQEHGVNEPYFELNEHVSLSVLVLFRKKNTFMFWSTTTIEILEIVTLTFYSFFLVAAFYENYKIAMDCK